MLYDETAVKANIRNREGRRVFFLGKEDRLTPSARDWLNRERIAILSGEEAKITRYRLVGGGFCEEKPEHMTHLHGDVLVPKTHPRIAFRGKVDLLEAELILCKLKTGIQGLTEILALARRLIRCDVLDEPVGDFTLCGLTAQEQRRRSHFPQEHFGIAHFMPEAEDGDRIALLNRCRALCRSAELAACHAFTDRDGNPTRPDILQALNRMSSMLYILMLEEKAKK
jgi:ethanolamine utilization cobalamin adenosyltransferase